MKVLLVHERFPPDFGGGGEYIILETARGLRRFGHSVQVVTTGDPAESSYDGFPITRIAVSRYRFNLSYRRVALMASDHDVILSAFYHGAWNSVRASRIAGRSVATIVLGLFGDAWTRMRPWPLGHAWMAWERHLLRLPFDRLVFLSEFSRSSGIAAGAAEERSVVCSPGIELNAYGPATPKDKAVLFSGKLETRKGVNDVLTVARRLPHVQFRILGWGPEEQRLRREAPSNMSFLEYETGEPGSQLRQAFARASIFFFPSYAETFGIVLVEAMASGCAIVSSVPLPFDGALVRAGDLDAMTAAVERLWNNPALTERLGNANIARAQEFTWDNYTARLVRNLEEIATERSTPR
jgi:glycosyltransferase involved in cell wall biosynthesis